MILCKHEKYVNIKDIRSKQSKVNLKYFQFREDCLAYFLRMKQKPISSTHFSNSPFLSN